MVEGGGCREIEMQVVGRWRWWFGEAGGLQIPVNSNRSMKSFFSVKEESARYAIPKHRPSHHTADSTEPKDS